MSRIASIDTLRAQIDSIDERILKLLNRRARLAIQVGHTKAGRGQSTYAPEREKKVFARLERENAGPLRSEHVAAIFREVISSCLSLEQALRIVYLGPAGTYSEEAARRQFGSGAALTPAGSVDAVFDEVERGRADYGVVPVENSTEGVVAQTLDRFVPSPLSIKAEVLLRIDHCLLARRGGPRRFRRILSHPQSLAQCRSWLARTHPDVPTREVSSNAAAAAAAARQQGVAAIAGREAALRYGLEVVAESIQDLPNNSTRFLVIGRDGHGTPSGDDKTTLLFSVPHEAGALYKVLEAFARARINLSTIESRPLKGRAWEYVFFLDVAGHANEAAMKGALRGLQKSSQFVKVLGSYPAWRWPEEKGGR